MPGVDLGAATTVSWALGVNGVTVVLTVTKPDGSTVTPAPTVTESSGVYSASVPSSLPGRYLLSWSKDATPDAAFTDVLNVWPADPRFMLSIADVREYVGLAATDTSADSKLRLFSASATVVIEDIVGAVLVRTVTQKANGGKTGVALWERITESADITVTVDGTVQTEDTDYTIDRNAAIVYAGGPTSPGRFPAGRQNISIEYSVGEDVIPPNLLQAAGELIRHLYQFGHQAVHAEWSDAPSTDDLAETPSGWLVPRRVLQLCRASSVLPGIG